MTGYKLVKYSTGYQVVLTFKYLEFGGLFYHDLFELTNEIGNFTYKIITQYTMCHLDYSVLATRQAHFNEHKPLHYTHSVPII